MSEPQNEPNWKDFWEEWARINIEIERQHRTRIIELYDKYKKAGYFGDKDDGIYTWEILKDKK